MSNFESFLRHLYNQYYSLVNDFLPRARTFYTRGSSAAYWPWFGPRILCLGYLDFYVFVQVKLYQFLLSNQKICGNFCSNYGFYRFGHSYYKYKTNFQRNRYPFHLDSFEVCSCCRVLFLCNKFSMNETSGNFHG